MPTNESYIKLRNEALALNESAQCYSFCKAIDGGCCKRDLRLLPEDREGIIEAVESGDIDDATLQRALQRAKDDELEFCPFLGEQGECTIYPHRPVVCIQHGNGGLPKDKSVAMRAVKNPGKKTIKVDDMELFSCTACAEHYGKNERIPLTVVGRSIAILLNIQDAQRHYGERRMNEFLIDQFSDS